MRTFLVKTLFYIVGLTIISLGVTLTIKADLGAGAWDAMNVGLTEIIGFSVGNWVIIIGSILIGTNALIARERPDILAVVTILVIGKMIDFWLITGLAPFSFTGFLTQFIFLILGIVVIAIGVSLYLQPNYSLNPIDGWWHYRNGLAYRLLSQKRSRKDLL